MKCPEPVIIWRIALAAISTLNSWCLSASNDGSASINLLTSNERLEDIALNKVVPEFFVLSESYTTAYQCYKFKATEGGVVEIKFMQLYVYDT